MGGDSLRREVESIESLAGALRWALGRTPPAEFVDVIEQDEFWQDVIVRVDERTWVVFDTT